MPSHALVAALIGSRVAAVAALPTFRMLSLGAAVVETGDDTAGRNYTASGDSQASGASVHLGASADGFWQCKMLTYNPAAANSAFVGWTLSSSPLPDGAGGYTNISYGAYAETTAAAGVWKVFSAGLTVVATSAVPSALGDVLRTSRVGTSLAFEVSKDDGGTWTTLHTFTGVSAALYPAIAFQPVAQAANLRHTGLT